MLLDIAFSVSDRRPRATRFMTFVVATLAFFSLNSRIGFCGFWLIDDSRFRSRTSISRSAVTAEAASSSLVVPAIPSKPLRMIGSYSFNPQLNPQKLVHCLRSSPPARSDQVAPCIYLDRHMLCGVYKDRGICVRNHCGAEPPRDIEPPDLVPTVGGRDRAPASYDAADRVKAPASAARGRFRGIHGGRTAPSLPAESRTISGAGCLAGSVPPVLVRSRGCSGTPPRSDGSIHTNETRANEKRTNEKED